MADLQFHSRSLASQYVFYQRLLEHPSPDMRALGAAAQGRMGQAGDLGNRMPPIVAQLRAMAATEASKEAALLDKVFGVPIQIDPMDREFYTNLTKALNDAMSLKAVFERNVARIKAGETQISIAGLFPSYFGTVWSENSESIMEQIKARVKGRVTAAQAANAVLTQELPKLVDLAITKMFKSNDFKDDPSHQGYQELLNYFNSTPWGSELSRQLYQIYHLDELKDVLIQTLKEDKKKGKYTRARRKDVDAIVGRARYSDGGLSLEYFENFVINAVISGSAGANGYSVTGKHTGDLGVKADNVVAFGIDPNLLEEILQSQESVNRERNVQMFTNLNNRLKQLDDGFIVYSNAKNYSLSGNFKGFSGGQGMSLQTYGHVISSVSQNTGTLLGAIANTIPGAVGEGQKGALTKIIAADIAYFLFDDVEAIGVDSGGAKALHVFNLDGIYIPLSCLLFELADAIEQAMSNPSDIVKVTITTPSGVAFPPGEDTGMARWNEQRAIALNNIRISATFLANFQSLIGRL